MRKFDKIMVPWIGTFERRLRESVAFLYVHGYLSDSEKDKVRKRVEKDYLKVSNSTGLDTTESENEEWG